MSDNTLQKVRAQYEALPYPPVNPEDEHTRLVHTWLDDLPMLNHYCFGGRESFRNQFRVLVAGGGTGDSTILLAEQLRHTDAHIVHLDFSSASIAIAKRRAEIRRLDNIEWIQDSLLNIPALGLAPFDYINCIGVLHHLSDPDEGLKALRPVLKPSGAMGLMVYGKYGRTGIYQMQDLMRRINDPAAGIESQIVNSQQVLGVLPATNWFKRCEDIWQSELVTDADIYDVMLHSQDRAYTVPELYEWLVDGHGLNIEFTAVNQGRSAYTPRMVMGPHVPKVLQRIEEQPARQQHAIAELTSGSISRHTFYLTQTTFCSATYGDADQVPFFFHEPLTGPMIAGVFHQNKGKRFQLNHPHLGLSVGVEPGRYAAQILSHVDGKKNFQEIFDLVRRESPLKFALPSNDSLFQDFRSSYEVLNAIDRLLLRHRSVDSMALA